MLFKYYNNCYYCYYNITLSKTFIESDTKHWVSKMKVSLSGGDLL